MDEITWTDGHNFITFTDARWLPFTLNINGVERPVKGRKGDVIGIILGKYNGKNETQWHVHKGDRISITDKSGK